MAEVIVNVLFFSTAFLFGLFVGRITTSACERIHTEPEPKKNPDPFADKVKCSECRHWVDRSDAQRISHSAYGYSFDEFYCPTHKKPYSRSSSTGMGWRYFGEIEMTEDGKPIAPKKK